METSALDSTNVEHAFNEVLTGMFSPGVISVSSVNDLLIFVSLFPAIQKKVASREVTRGSICAVTLSDTAASNAEAQQERRSCCKSS